MKTVKTFRSQDRRYFNVSLQTGSPRGVWNDAECTVGSSIYLTGVIGESGWYTLSNFCFIKMGNRLDIFSHNCYRYINLKSRLYLNNQAPRPNGEGDINLNISRALIVFVYVPSILFWYLKTTIFGWYFDINCLGLDLGLDNSPWFMSLLPIAFVKEYTDADTQKEQILQENKGKSGIYCWINKNKSAPPLNFI